MFRKTAMQVWIIVLALSFPFSTAASAQLLSDFSDKVSELTQETKKAVVFVTVSKTVRQDEQQLFDFFFGQPFGPGGGQPQLPDRRQAGVGSGFFIDLGKGLVVTNNHVIEGADEITLKLANGTEQVAKVVGRDANTDLAVIKIESEKFPRNGLKALEFADSDQVKVGALAIAVGAPFGLESSMSLGVVSATGRGSLGITQLGDFMQTDAAINPGNSGGPLVDADGRVIGVNTAIYSRSGSSAGIGFAIPSNLARMVTGRLVTSGKFDRGYLGVSLQPLSKQLAEGLGIKNDTEGTIVASVEPNGPADDAGIQEGDVIVAVNGTDVKTSTELVNAVGFKAPREKVTVTVNRSGKQQEFTVTLGTWPEGRGQERSLPTNGAEPGEQGGLGLSVAPLTDELKSRFNIAAERGLLITGIAPDSPARAAGVSPGDVILSADRQEVKTPEDLRAKTKGKDRVLLHLQRGTSMFFATVSSQKRGDTH